MPNFDVQVGDGKIGREEGACGAKVVECLNRDSPLFPTSK
jgi:hypothetical protein